jgi:LPS-assembly lipoprotein
MSRTMNRSIFLFVASLLIAGCGFRPLYGTGDTGAGQGVGTELASIYVEPLSERVGYELRNNLLDLMNAQSRTEGAAYRLKLNLREELTGVAIRPNASITRYNYTLIVHYDLLPAGKSDPAHSGNARSLAAYNVALSPYATVTAERDAKDRAARDIAERIRTELAVYFRQRSQSS